MKRLQRPGKSTRNKTISSTAEITKNLRQENETDYRGYYTTKHSRSNSLIYNEGGRIFLVSHVGTGTTDPTAGNISIELTTAF